jgi:hypothetical protein
MTYPYVPEPSAIAAHFVQALSKAQRKEDYYLRWLASFERCCTMIRFSIDPIIVCTA